jgi:putative glutamine amidotransferase
MNSINSRNPMNPKTNMRRPLIGITTDIEGEYLKLKHYYPDAIIKAGGVPLLIPPAGNTLYAKSINGLIIPGGDDLDPFYYNEALMPHVKPVSRKRSDFELSLLKEVVSLRKPILGICYGMQLINVAFGGTLYQDIDSQVSVEINHKKDYHMIVIAENRFLKKGKFSVNSTHHQAIKELGTDLLAFAYSTDNLIEAFYMKDYPFLVGVQWHPERLPDNELSVKLFKSFVEASSDSK